MKTKKDGKFMGLESLRTSHAKLMENLPQKWQFQYIRKTYMFIYGYNFWKLATTKRLKTNQSLKLLGKKRVYWYDYYYQYHNK